ncbi:hypothetical protein RchiOBHm_Chr2g0146921 [Rosa chinensis]|uniref:Uncharacterized protein n=1 Tax=Rosa chinensis TaxID=74649 RepID=A0A2P6RZ06_ROSCH|nr:hypothetical protein RchiOBHm_Chr2g0146921 [Rosa chinensis]
MVWRGGFGCRVRESIMELGSWWWCAAEWEEECIWNEVRSWSVGEEERRRDGMGLVVSSGYCRLE